MQIYKSGVISVLSNVAWRRHSTLIRLPWEQSLQVNGRSYPHVKLETLGLSLPVSLKFLSSA